MKIVKLAVIAVAFLAGLSQMAPYACAEGDTAALVADHQAMAASYESKANAQGELIGEHTQMKQDYKQRFYINEKVTPTSGLEKMNEHCDAIIGDAKKLQAELLDFAKWHRMRAAELQGQ